MTSEHRFGGLPLGTSEPEIEELVHQTIDESYRGEITDESLLEDARDLDWLQSDFPEGFGPNLLARLDHWMASRPVDSSIAAVRGIEYLAGSYRLPGAVAALRAVAARSPLEEARASAARFLARFEARPEDLKASPLPVLEPPDPALTGHPLVAASCLAIVDFAALGGDVSTLRAIPARVQMLFQGELALTVADQAPHLADLRREGLHRHRYLDLLWGRSAAVWFSSEASFAEVRSHLRRFFLVRDESGREVFFRYYDPRVLREFLPACTWDELVSFFGPVAVFYCEGDEPTMMHRFTLDPSRGALHEGTELVALPRRLVRS